MRDHLTELTLALEVGLEGLSEELPDHPKVTWDVFNEHRDRGVINVVIKIGDKDYLAMFCGPAGPLRVDA